MAEKIKKDERIAELERENEQLKKELAEKDEELKGLRIVKEVDEATKNGLRKTVDLLYDSLKTNHDKFEKNLRHEICEKIIEFIDKNEDLGNINIRVLKDFLYELGGYEWNGKEKI